jgi:hypothetical protein
MSLRFRPDATARDLRNGCELIEMHDVVSCGAASAMDKSWIWFADDKGNLFHLYVQPHLATRLHACWAATAPTPIAPTTPRR